MRSYAIFVWVWQARLVITNTTASTSLKTTSSVYSHSDMSVDLSSVKKKKKCFQYQFVHCNYQAKYTQGCFYFMYKEFLQIKKKQIHIPGGKWVKIFNGHSQEPPWMSNKPRRCKTTLPISENENVSIYKIRKVEQDRQDLLLVRLERLSNTHSW